MKELLSVLALDVGDRRIGVAGCDGTGLIASGITTIRRKSMAADVGILQELVEQRQAQKFIVGLPLNMSGSEGFQARKVRKFMKAVVAKIPLPVEYVDERLTTVQAKAHLQAAGVSFKGKRELVDRAAAATILQQWLDMRRDRERQVRLRQEMAGLDGEESGELISRQAGDPQETNNPSERRSSYSIPKREDD